MSFTAIGDSVMLDSAPYLQDINPKIVVDAKVGRQAYEAPNLVKKWLATMSWHRTSSRIRNKW